MNLLRILFQRPSDIQVSFDSIIGWNISSVKWNHKIIVSEQMAFRIIAALKRMFHDGHNGFDFFQLEEIEKQCLEIEKGE